MLLKLRPIIAEFNDRYDVKIRVDEQKYIGRDFHVPALAISQEITSKIGSKLYIGKVRLQSQSCPEIGRLAYADDQKSSSPLEIFVRGADKAKDSSVFYCKERGDPKLNLESIILNLDFWFGAQGHYNDEREDTEPDF